MWMWLVACGLELSKPAEDTDLTFPPKGTQVGDEGTQVTGACTPEILSESSLLDGIITVGEVLASLRTDTVVSNWFDGRNVGVQATLSYTGGPLQRLGSCVVLAEVETTIVSDDGAVSQTFVSDAVLDPGGTWMLQYVDVLDWMGSLTQEDLLTEPCPRGQYWRLQVDQRIDGQSSGYVAHSCEGSPGDFTTPTSGDTGTHPSWTDTGTGGGGDPPVTSTTSTTSYTTPGSTNLASLDDTASGTGPVGPYEVLSW